MNRAFRNKIGYLVAIVVLLLPLSYLSQPKVAGQPTGGKLAQLRAEQGLSQASLGDIDPTSETLKLAMLGMRGVAANVLWTKAIEAKKTEDWSGFEIALNQITNLQPNYQSVWYFQGWNISYNISVEFDDYHDRYRWVMRGVDYLKEGMKYNRKDPELPYQVGWFLKQKIGHSDEKRQFRRLFREDKDYHGDRPLAERDSFLVAREWFEEAEKVARESNVTSYRRSPLIFYSEQPHCLSDYAAALEQGDDSLAARFGEVAQKAWRDAFEAWMAFGNRPYGAGDGLEVRLNELARYERIVAEGMVEMEKLLPGSAEKLFNDKRAELSAEQREAFDTPPAQRTAEQANTVEQERWRLRVTPLEMATYIGEQRPELAEQANQLAQRLNLASSIRELIEYQWEIVNYRYWLTQSTAEQTIDAIEAREAFYQAEKAWREELDLNKARELYEQGFKRWELVERRFGDYVFDDNTIDELFPIVRDYRELLEAYNEPLPENFHFQYVLNSHYARYPDEKTKAK